MPFIYTLLGLILLLGGMKILRSGLEHYAGSNFKKTLLQLTSTPQKGFVSGMVAAGLLQSSTALTVMAVSFVDARLLSFQNTLGLILGSNVGTTITPQLLAFPIGKYAPFLILPSLGGFFLLKKRPRFLLLAFAGLGIMFLSLSILESAMLPLTEMQSVKDYLRHIGENPLKGVFTGTVLAAVLHSSSAATGIVMVLTEESWLSMPAALACIFGANIGTCFTALIVSFFTSRAAQRVAIFHVILNLFGAVIFLPFLSITAELIMLIGGNLARQVANAHTIFNLISSLIVLPLLSPATKLLLWLRKED